MGSSGCDYDGRRVTVMGLGRFGGGVGVARFLAGRGADVLVTDMLPAGELAASVAQLDGVAGVSFRLGEHNVSDFTTCDLLVVNPAVKPGNRFVRAARAAGVEITSEIRLLVRHLPDRKRTIGVTGSAGKSTVTAMVGHILKKGMDEREAWSRGAPSRTDYRSSNVWVGGNIGGSLLQRLDEIDGRDWVVLELSSFMLEGLRLDRWSPHIAVVTNISPNHIDWHGSFEAYVRAKQAVLDFQSNADRDSVVYGFGVTDLLTPKVERQMGWEQWYEFDEPGISLSIPGEHNQLNACLAHFAAETAADGFLFENGIDSLFEGFRGLPHRLEFVGERAGVRYFNDSKSTTPEAARLAVEAFPEQSVRIVLGGSDKGSDLAPLARFAAERCAGIYTIGTTGDAIADAAEAYEPSVGRPESCGAVAWPPPTATVRRCGTLDAAIAAIAADVRSGENVVLSPGCASWDQFANYEARGNAFVAGVTTDVERLGG